MDHLIQVVISFKLLILPSCIKIINFQYLTKDEISCSFETNECGWYNDESSQIQFTRKQGEAAFNKTGPQVDHTIGQSVGWLIGIGKKKYFCFIHK